MTEQKASPPKENWIFPPARPLAAVMEETACARANPDDPIAQHRAEPQWYANLYRDVIRQLRQRKDLFKLPQAASRQGIAADDYLRQAAAGEVIVFKIETAAFIPKWQFGPGGAIDPLVLDIAREFSTPDVDHFRFQTFLRFMTETRADITPSVPKKALRDFFRKAGLSHDQTTIEIQATMLQLVQQRRQHPEFWDVLVRHLDGAVTYGGWDPRGGLSRPFRDKYDIPGLTIEEAWAKADKDQPSP